MSKPLLPTIPPISQWPWLEILPLLGSIMGTAFVLSVLPPNNSLVQLFCLLLVLYLIARRLLLRSQQKRGMSQIDLLFLVCTIALLVGGTGGLQSVFFPAVVIQLFFIFMFVRQSSGMLTTLALAWLYFGTTMHPEPQDLALLVTIGLMGLCFLIAKQQYHILIQDEYALDKDERRITRLQMRYQNLLVTLKTFVIPKLSFLITAAEHPIENQHMVQQQLKLITSTIENALPPSQTDQKSTDITQK